MAFSRTADSDSVGSDPVFGLVLINAALYGVPIVWLLWKAKGGRLKLPWLVGSAPRDYNWWGLVGIVALLMLFSIGTIILTSFVLGNIWPEYAESMGGDSLFLSAMDTAYPQFYNVLTAIQVVIVAPVMEEIVFRGFLFTRWSVRWGPVRALVFTSVLFGALHLDPIGAFGFGAMMVILYVRTGTLLVPIAAHMLNNGVVTGIAVLVWFSDAQDQAATGAPTSTEVTVWLAFVAVTGFFLVRFGFRWWRRRPALLPYFRNEVPTFTNLID